MQAMVSYGTKDFRIGGNYLNNTDKANSATGSSTHGGNASAAFSTAALGDEVKSTGYSVWGWTKLGGGFGAFGRVESLQNKFSTGGVANINKEKVTRLVGGIEYSPVKNVTISAVFDTTKLNNRGGLATVQDKDDRIGIYTQVKL